MVCSVLTFEVVYNDTSGVIEYALVDDDEVIVDLSSITKVVFKIGETIIDSSQVAAGIITWDDTADYYGQEVNVVKALLGGEGLVAGSYENCRMTVYDPANLNGIVWSDTLNIRVED